MFKALVCVAFIAAVAAPALAYTHTIFAGGSDYEPYSMGGIAVAQAKAEDRAEQSLYNMCYNGNVYNVRVTNRNCFTDNSGGGSCTVSMQAVCAQ